MPRVRDGVGEIPVLHRVRRLRHRGLDEPFAAACGGVVLPGQFDDAEQLVAQPREGAAEQPGGILQPPLPPDPAVPLERQPQPERRRAREQDRQPQPARRLQTRSSAKTTRIGERDAEERGEQALGQLDDPDAPPEIGELRFEDGGSGVSIRFVNIEAAFDWM